MKKRRNMDLKPKRICKNNIKQVHLQKYEELKRKVNIEREELETSQST